MSHPDIEPGDTMKYYATVSADINCLTARGVQKCARFLRVGVAGNLEIVDKSGYNGGPFPVAAGELIGPLNIKTIIDAGTTAAELKVYW